MDREGGKLQQKRFQRTCQSRSNARRGHEDTRETRRGHTGTVAPESPLQVRKKTCNYTFKGTSHMGTLTQSKQAYYYVCAVRKGKTPF